MQPTIAKIRGLNFFPLGPEINITLSLTCTMAHTGPLPKDFARSLKRRAQAISKGKTQRKPKPPKQVQENPMQGEKSIMPIPNSNLNWVQQAEERAKHLHPWLFDKTILVSRAELGKWCKFDCLNDPPLSNRQLALLEQKRVEHVQKVAMKQYQSLKENGWVTPPRERSPTPFQEEYSASDLQDNDFYYGPSPDSQLQEAYPSPEPELEEA